MHSIFKNILLVAMAAIATVGISKVYYGNTRQEAEGIGYNDAKDNLEALQKYLQS